MNPYTLMILVGMVVGIVCRMLMLKTDYRQYPTYLHGRIVHIALGIIASALGAVAVPSMLQQNYTAVTFLTVAASQFRDVRNMERQTLTNVDQNELVPRGITYIEGIAMVFEGRNYLVILTSFIGALATHYFNWYGGVIIGGLTVILLIRYASGNFISDIARIREGTLRFDGPNLYVEDIHIMNIALQDSKDKILRHGLGIILEPKTVNDKITLSHLGQRQAIIHDISTLLGVYRDSGTPSFVPLSKRDLESGRVGFFLLPMEKNVLAAQQIIGRCPVLEHSIRKPLESEIVRHEVR